MVDQANSMNWEGKGEASKNSPAAKLHVTEFFNIPDAHQLQMFSSFRCWFRRLQGLDYIPRPFLQAKFWHLCLRGQREIQEAGNKKRRKGKSRGETLILHELYWSFLLLWFHSSRDNWLISACLSVYYPLRACLSCFFKYNWMCKKILATFIFSDKFIMKIDSRIYLLIILIMQYNINIFLYIFS